MFHVIHTAKASQYSSISNYIAQFRPQKSKLRFFHTEAKKAALFSKVRSGDVRVLLGSTAKMGAGTNVQSRLVAVHHLDVGWKPSDMTQRNGRIIWQGNINKEVKVFNYVTEGTFDLYLYQTLENAIEQAKCGKLALYWQRTIQREYSGKKVTPDEQQVYEQLQSILSEVPQWSGEEDLRHNMENIGGRLWFCHFWILYRGKPHAHHDYSRSMQSSCSAMMESSVGS